MAMKLLNQRNKSFAKRNLQSTVIRSQIMIGGRSFFDYNFEVKEISWLCSCWWQKLFFEFSKPTGGAWGPFGQDKSGQHRNITVPSFWMCTSCGCVNFARRTSCLQCNKPRADDAPPADIAFIESTILRKARIWGRSNSCFVCSQLGWKCGWGDASIWIFQTCSNSTG